MMVVRATKSAMAVKLKPTLALWNSITCSPELRSSISGAGFGSLVGSGSSPLKHIFVVVVGRAFCRELVAVATVAAAFKSGAAVCA